MQRTWRVMVAISACLFFGALATAAEEPAKSPVVRFRDGDFVSGSLLDSEEVEFVSWKAEGFDQPLRIPLNSVDSIQFPTPTVRPDSAGSFCFELREGGQLCGELVSLDRQEAVLQISGLGALHVERKALSRFYRASPADLIFAGPNGLEGWETSGSDLAWQNEAGQLRTTEAGASLSRDFQAPPLARYELELSWTDKPNFELSIDSNQNPPHRAAFLIETWGDELVVTRESEKHADLAVLQKLGPGAGQVRVVALFDRPNGCLLVFSSSGEKLADLIVPEEKSALPTPAIADFPVLRPDGLEDALEADSPDLPRGLRLTNRRGDLKLQRLTINRWSGVAPQPAGAGQAAVHLTDGTIRSAEVHSFDRAERRLVLVAGGREQRIDERQLQDVVLSQPGDDSTSPVRVLFANGARLSGALSQIQHESLTLKCPGIQGPLVLPVKDLQAVHIFKDEGPGDTAPVAGRQPHLELPGVSLHGQLVDAATGEHSCLIFHPRNSNTASSLVSGINGRLTLRQPPPPPKPRTPDEAMEPPSSPIVSGLRSMFGFGNNKSSRPAPAGGCLLHLRSGDTLPCTVQFIDERGVTFKSAVTEASFVSHERIKALELRPTAPPVKIEKARFERLLTLPRMQRDNPPEQLIRSLQGDYVRGRLLAMNDKELQLEIRLETKAIDRAQVTRIIWLHPDEVAKATVVKPAAADTLPVGTRVQAVPRDGNRLTFFAQEVSGKILSGQSDVLGACRVDLDHVDQLLIGDAIEEAAALLTFHQWKLRPAAEPLPDPEPGSDPNSGAGMESVLVGKPAPDIELDLLDGEKFRLSDRKNKIVVLDFWASWCGPCLQVMPQVDTVTREFAEQGVQLVAINLEESPDQIKTALNRLKLEMAVALDRDGRVAERYGAASIPQTVIIDRNGKVARLFIGGGARFDEQLRQSLREVLVEPNSEVPME